MFLFFVLLIVELLRFRHFFDDLGEYSFAHGADIPWFGLYIAVPILASHFVTPGGGHLPSVCLAGAAL